MKCNLLRGISLLVALVLALGLFSGCQKEDDVTKTDVSGGVSSKVDETLQNEYADNLQTAHSYFTIAQSADKKVVLVIGDDGAAHLVVSDSVTLDGFEKEITVNQGFAFRVLDQKGNEVTDGKTRMATGMRFCIFNEATGKTEIEYPIEAQTEKEFEKSVELADQQEEQAKNEGSVSSAVSSVSSVVSQVSSDSSKPPVNNQSPLSGQDIVLGSIWHTYYTNSDALGKAWQNCFSSIYKNYDSSTKVISLDAGSAVDMIVKEVMAGKAGADLYEVSIAGCRSIARKKAAAELQNSKTIDFAKFDSAGTKCVTFSKKVYGVAFDGMGATPMGVFYNKDIVKKYAADYDIEKLYQEKKWTFDAMKAIAQLCTQDTNGDGKTDIYGLYNCGHIIGMALAANAGGTAAMNEEGRVVASMCSAAGVEALEWCKSLVKDKIWYYTNDINTCNNEFANGRSAFLATFFHYYPTIVTKADFQYGFVPMPIGPAMTDYQCNNYDGRVYVVPKTKESRLNEIGVWLNEAASMGNRMINIELTQMARNGFDATARNTYRWIVDNMKPEYACFSTEISAAVDNSVASKTKDPAKIMDSIRSKAQLECDDFYGELY